MNISIIIPSYQAQESIGKTIDSLVCQEVGFPFEVLVVDCSPHNQVEQIVTAYSMVRYIRENKRFSPGIGRNIGAKKAKGKLLMFIDSDVQLAQNSLDAIWETYGEGKMIFGGALELNTRIQDNMAAYLEHYFFNSESQAGRSGGERSNLSSALLCFDAELFREAGGFRDIPRMQDTELTERIRKKGCNLYFEPKIVAYQIQDSTLKEVLRKIYINGQNLYFIRYQSSMTLLKRAGFLFLIPVIAFAKITRIVIRHLCYQSAIGKLRILELIPAISLAGAIWGFALFKAVLDEQGVSPKR